MKNKANPLKVKKNINKTILVLVLLILLVSVFLLILSVSSTHKSPITYKTHGKSGFFSKAKRHFNIESSQDNIYNLGEYNVNLNYNRILIINISIQTNQEAFDTLNDYNILIQSAVLDAFSDQSSLHMASTLQGKEKIKRHILANINKALHQPLVNKVYFNRFIIQ